MNLEIINIGDELLIGQVVNTNASFLAQELNKVGVVVSKVTTIGDKAQDIETALDLALSNADSVLITGGLGPTKDDITKQVLANYFDTTLIEDNKTLEKIRHYFEQRNLPLTQTNRKQALLPQNADIIENNYGTAAAMCFKKDNKLVFSLPGVPFEMKEMMPEVIKRLQNHYKLSFIEHKTLLVSGIGESFLSDIIEQWEDSLPNFIRLAYLPNAGIIRLRLSAYGNDKNLITSALNEQINKLMPLIKDYFLSFEQSNPSQTLVQILNKIGKTLATAESCTGGNIAHQITLNAGASSVYQGSVVAYSNDIKQCVLGVKPETLSQFGAVSEQTAKEMVRGVMSLLQTDYAIATTGIAGPTGGTSDKPVGTVWICVCDNKGNDRVAKCFFPTNRANFIDRTTTEALLLLLNLLQQDTK
ncbi:MAG: competence/damage-inducible protein A [Bacteroidales bacterium]|jgi:nicotinamide-nucleotide amidase|nr:competence/damage-inducible protein A [Bacteroidales bacterium]